MEQTINKNPRIEVVDALRGFAVMAIILVHNLEHFIFPVYPTQSPSWLNILDQGIFNGTFALFAGKAYAIFALLFGFTFYIQTSNQKNKRERLWLSFSMADGSISRFCHTECGFFPCRRCAAAFCGCEYCLIPYS